MRRLPALALGALTLWAWPRPAGALRTPPAWSKLEPYQVMHAQYYDVSYDHDACRISSNESCSFQNMRRNFVTMVYPGGRSRCMFSDAPEFGFAVVPRDPHRLLFYFEEGGACWNLLSQSVKACTVNASKAPPLLGILNGSALANPMRNHTVVYVTGCSGDLHSGDVQQRYKDARGVRIEQRGFHNTWSAIRWVRNNLASRQPLSSLIATGDSAGSIATQVWAHTLLTQIPHERASVIADSYLGAFPDGFQGPIFRSLNVCTSGLLQFNDSLMTKCWSGTVTIPDVYEAAIAAHPEVSFGSVTSKYDLTQLGFYKLALASKFDLLTTIRPLRFREKGEAILARYLKYPNHGHFILSSTWHGYSNMLYSYYPYFTSICFGGDDRAQGHLERWFGHYAAHDSRAGRHCEVLSADKVKLIQVQHAEPDTCPPFDGTQMLISSDRQALGASGTPSAEVSSVGALARSPGYK